MDRLTDEERILAWKAAWHPSFDGVAIVDRDFTFRSANPQFCKLLGVTPADLIGQRFQDITPQRIRELDQKNAQMVIDGFIDFYLLPKSYEFTNGNQVNVVLLVTRAPLSSEGEFQFFVSRIMLDESGALHSVPKDVISHSKQSSRMLINLVAEFLMQNIKILVALGAALGAIFLGFIELMEKF